MRITRAVTHIRLCAVNDAKIAALDALAAEYIALCQQYMTHFCTQAEPNGSASPSSRPQTSQGLGAPITNARKRTLPTISPPGWRRSISQMRPCRCGFPGRRPR
jgi:hypothetical protein